MRGEGRREGRGEREERERTGRKEEGEREKGEGSRV